MASYMRPLAHSDENAMNLAEDKAGNAGKGLGQAKNGSRRPLQNIANVVGAGNPRVGGKENVPNKADNLQKFVQIDQRVTRQKAKEANIDVTVLNAQPIKRGTARRPPAKVVQPGNELEAVNNQRERSKGKSWSECLLERADNVAEKTTAPAVAPISPFPDIDSQDKHNPLAAYEYANDIFKYFKRVEHMFRASPDYMSQQVDVNEKMRAILIDWLVEVHYKFKLMPETLFLTINLIDRFLEARTVNRRHLQLVGVTAMLIASKYEEIWAPEVRDYVYISDRAYTREQILEMEKLMLNTLKFNLTVPTCHPFLQRFMKAAGYQDDKDLAMYASYLVELALPEYSMLKYPSSIISAAAVYAASIAMNKSDPYPYTLQKHSGYKVEAVHGCAVDLAKLFSKAPNATLHAVYKKYCNVKFHEVSKKGAPVSLLEQNIEA